MKLRLVILSLIIVGILTVGCAEQTPSPVSIQSDPVVYNRSTPECDQNFTATVWTEEEAYGTNYCRNNLVVTTTSGAAPVHVRIIAGSNSVSVMDGAGKLVTVTDQDEFLLEPGQALTADVNPDS